MGKIIILKKDYIYVTIKIGNIDKNIPETGLFVGVFDQKGI